MTKPSPADEEKRKKREKYEMERWLREMEKLADTKAYRAVFVKKK